MRWQHPRRGLVSPGEFIPLAEETGLIVPMGEWVLETACRQARAWRDAGYPDLRMAVNLSPRQFRQPLLADTVRRALQNAGLPAENLELEITESVAMDDPAQSRRIMHELKAIGVSLAVDDFGTGHSSLGYLSNFPIDYLKIDQSFVRGTPANAENAVIVRTVIALAHNLSLEVIAEGIETDEQRDFLQSEGCEEAQGFLFGRPQPADETLRLLEFQWKAAATA
jgi:EAL domain-containing protein (putative c-di-GMP-specific phosphodiesterase class I)